MSTPFMPCRAALVLALVLPVCAANVAARQHPWQAPPAREPNVVAEIAGPIVQPEPSRDLDIVWVWGVDKNHERGAHEYGWGMGRFVNTLLPLVPRVTAERAMYFPTAEQWARADVVVFYLQSPEPWSQEQYEQIDAFQSRGGGLMFFHLAILQGAGSELAARIGLAYASGDSPNGPTRWGPLPTPVHLTKAGLSSEILEGFGPTVDLVDEHYWNLHGDADGVTTLMTAPGGPALGSEAPPRPDELDGNAWPVMWTTERGRGRVFATVLGHNYFTFNDPYFRIMLLRGLAWTLGESFDPFKPLVTIHLER